MDKKQREARRRQEDIALQRGLLWVAGAALLEGLLVLVNRFYINYHINEAEIRLISVLDEVFKALRMVGPVAAILCLAWTAWKLKNKKPFVLPLVLAAVSAAVAVCAHVIYKYQGPGVSMLFWLVVAWAVLALVYYIYQKEFFLAASACGMSVLALWFVRYGATGLPETILLAAAIALVGAAALWLKKNGGLLSGGEEPVRFLPKSTAYGVLLTTCAVSLLVVLVSVAVNSVAYYLIYAMVAWLFALFVYYTVKLM